MMIRALVAKVILYWIALPTREVTRFFWHRSTSFWLWAEQLNSRWKRRQS